MDLNEIYKKIIPDTNRLAFKANEGRLIRVAFDLFRLKDGNPEELWQVQSSDDGEFLVRTYLLPEEKEEMQTKWSVDPDKKQENLTIAYQNIPLLRIASKDYNVDDINILQRMLFKKLASDESFTNKLINSMSEEKRELLKQAGYPVKDNIKLMDLEKQLEKMAKTEELEKHLDEVSNKEFGRKRRECIDKSICVVCGESANEFDDQLSAKEFNITGLCQSCQNKEFEDEDEEEFADDSKELKKEEDCSVSPWDSDEDIIKNIDIKALKPESISVLTKILEKI
jgi:hypothetical protein